MAEVRIQLPDSAVMVTYASQWERDASLRLAESRQALAERTGYIPAWSDLDEGDREMAALEARNWLRAAAASQMIHPDPSDPLAVTPDPAREQAFEAWWAGVCEWVAGTDNIEGLAHEAFCVGWEAIRQEATTAHRAEQEAMHADLSQLLELLGLGTHARPQSPHEVFTECLTAIRTLFDEVQHFTGTWRELMVAMPDGYRCTYTCAEANAAASLYRALADSAAADRILAAHGSYDKEGDEHYQPPGEDGRARP